MKPWLGAGAEVEVELVAGAGQKSLPANGKKAAKRAPHEQIAAMEWIGMECALSCRSHTATARTSDWARSREREALGIGMRGREMDTDGTLALALGGAWGALLLWPDEGLRSRLEIGNRRRLSWVRSRCRNNCN